MKAEIQAVKYYSPLCIQTSLNKILRIVVCVFLCGIFLISKVNGQITYTWTGATSTAWNNTNNWTKSSGTSTPGTNATDIVIIPTSGTNAPTLSTALATSIASLTFTNTATTTLTITGQTLTVTGAVVINHANTNRTITITGTGTLSCNSFTVGHTGATFSNNRTLTYVNTLANLNVTGNFTLQTLRNSGFNGGVTVTHTSGIITASSLVTAISGAGGPPTASYAIGNTAPRLNLTGATPLTFAAITNTIDFVGTNAIVDYQNGSNVTFPASPAGINSYTNLIISGGAGAVKTFSANLSVATGLTVRAATTLALGTFTLTGGLTSITMETVGGGNGAAITGTTGDITLGGTITVNYTGSGDIVTGASITKQMSLQNVVRTMTVADDGDASTTDFTISGIISSSGTTGGITKAGTGTLALTNANTFDGAVTISAGILEANTVANASAASSLGDGAGTPAISIAAASTLRYTGSGHSTSRAITLTGDGAIIDASGSGLLTMSGAMSGATFDIVFTGTGSGLYSGAIGTTSGTVTKTGVGNWELSGPSTYTGVTTIAGGTLMAGAAVAVSTNGPFGFAASAIVMGTAATTTNNWSPALLINGAFTFARTITIANQATSGVYSIGGNTDNNATFSGTITFSRPFSVTQVATTSTNALTISASITGGVAGTKNVTFDNVGAVSKTTNAITNGTGTTAVVKSNSGILTMGVANDYTGGTTLNAGTINVNNISALGTVAGSFTINGGNVQNTTGGSITTNNHPMTWNADFGFTGTQPLNLGTGTVTMSADIEITTATAAVDLTVGGTISAAARSLTKAGAGSLNFVNQTISLNNVTIDAGELASTSGTMNVAGVFTNNATFTHNSGTIVMNNVASSIVNNSTLVFNNLTISATPTAQSQYNTSFSVEGTLATSGAINFSPTGGTITMSGSSGSISNASGTLAFSNLTVSGTTVSSTGNFSVVTAMSVTGVFNPAATSIISGAGTLSGTGTVNVTRTAATPSFGAQYTIANKTLANLTVNYNGAGAQTVSAENYGTLVISTNGTRTVTFVNGGTVRVSNVFTPTATNTTYVVTGNTFEYNGSGAQTITAFTYNNLIVSNAGVKTVLAGTTVNCQTVEINDSAVLTLPDTAILNVQG